MSTEGKVIRCRAAVAWGPKKPLTIETIDVAPPKAGEVRIRIVATSICHTDAYSLSGNDLEALFPAVMGHEGSGIVESVGKGVKSVKPGDHVIPVFIPQCRECDYCKSPKTNLCQKILATQMKGVLPDGTSRFSLNGKPVYHYMGCSTFSEYTVAAEISVAKIDPAAPLDVVCVLGCGVSTGYGGAVKTAQVEPGTTCAIWGLGAVGLAVALGCQHAGARQIVGVDTNPEKFEIAKKFGCTDFINPKDINEPIDEYVKKNFNGGFDYTFPCVGSVKVMNDAFDCAHKGWGTSVIVGVAPSKDVVSTRPFHLLTGKVWKGTGFGGWKSLDDIPLLTKKFVDGKLDLNLFITHHYSIEQINEAFSTLLSGKSLRSVLKYQ